MERKIKRPYTEIENGLSPKKKRGDEELKTVVDSTFKKEPFSPPQWFRR